MASLDSAYVTIIPNPGVMIRGILIMYWEQVLDAVHAGRKVGESQKENRSEWSNLKL